MTATATITLGTIVAIVRGDWAAPAGSTYVVTGIVRGRTLFGYRVETGNGRDDRRMIFVRKDDIAVVA